MPETFNSFIVEVNPVDLDFGGKSIWVDREAVILRCDFDSATFQILNRLVCAPMAELEFEGFRTQRLS